MPFFDVSAAEALATRVSRDFAESLRCFALSAGIAAKEVDSRAAHAALAFGQGLAELVDGARAHFDSEQRRLDGDQRALSEIFERLQEGTRQQEEEAQSLALSREKLSEERTALAAQRADADEIDRRRQRQLTEDACCAAGNRERLESEWRRLAEEADRLTQGQKRLELEHDQLMRDARKLADGQESERLDKERRRVAELDAQRLEEDRQRLDDERLIILRERQALKEDRDALLLEQRRLSTEAQQVAEDSKRLFERERCELEEGMRDLSDGRMQLDAERRRLVQDKFQLTEEGGSLNQDRCNLREELRKLVEEKRLLAEAHGSLNQERCDLREGLRKLAEERRGLKEEVRKFAEEQVQHHRRHGLPDFCSDRSAPARTPAQGCRCRCSCVATTLRPVGEKSAPRAARRGCNARQASELDCRAGVTCGTRHCHPTVGRSMCRTLQDCVGQQETTQTQRCGDVVELNVAGKLRVSLPRKALMQCSGSMLAERFGLRSGDLFTDRDGCVFVDFPPDIFLPLVEHLKARLAEEPGGRLVLPPHLEEGLEARFKDMLRYYGILEWVYRAATLECSVPIGAYDYALLPSSRTCTPWAPGDPAGEVVTLPEGWEVLSTEAEDLHAIIVKLMGWFRGTSRLCVANTQGGFNAFHTPLLADSPPGIRCDTDVQWLKRVGDDDRTFQFTFGGASLVIRAHSRALQVATTCV